MATNTKTTNWLKRRTNKNKNTTSLSQKRKASSAEDLEATLRRNKGRKLRDKTWIEAWMAHNYRM